MATLLYVLLLITIWPQLIRSGGVQKTDAVEEDWGDGLKVLTIYRPESCEHRAKKSDVIHYHYVGRLASDGSVFGKSFDYNTPYIVALGHGRIIPGMDRGLMGMCLWERRRVSFPPHLGYGARGVGTTIPPNSSLVFYVRLIKIERNGHVLGEDGDMVGLWNSGMVSYSNQDWQQAVDMMEEAIRLYNNYKDKALLCIKQCNGETSLSNSKKKVLKSDQSAEQFFLYGLKGKCISKCKSSSLPPQLHNPDPDVMEKFSRYLPYSYLQYSYYQMGEFEKAARSCFTFLHYNPTDEIALSGAPFYRTKLNLTANGFIYQDTAIISHQKSYIKGKEVYNQENWLEAVDLFENSLDVFKEGLRNCYLLCEDVIHVNLTEPNINTMKKKLLDEYGFKSDTMEYYQLLQTSIKEVLQCRDTCYDRLCIIEGQFIEDYLSSHFNYLQFAHFKLGNIYKASEAAATYLALQPSSDVMTSNLQYYSSTYKLSSEDLVPMKEFVDIYEHHEMNRQLLYFVEHGEMKKREGRKGDNGERHQSHKEL